MVEKHIKRIIWDEVVGRLPSLRGNDNCTNSALKDDIACLFSKEPVNRPEPNETRILKKYYTEYLATLIKLMISSSDKKSIADAYKGYERYKKSGFGDGSRCDYGIIGEEFCDAIHRRTGSKENIYVVDFGAQRCEFISGVREKFKHDGVNVTATSLRYAPHMPVDEYALAPFEWLPKRFENRFDVAVSNTALEYSVMPHLALRGIARTLAPEGEAFLDIQNSQVLQIIYLMRNHGLGKCEKQYLEYLEHKVPYRSKYPEVDPVKYRINALIHDELEDISQIGYEVKVDALKRDGNIVSDCDIGDIKYDSKIFFAHIKRKDFI